MILTKGSDTRALVVSDHPIKSEHLGAAKRCPRVSLFEWGHQPSADEVAQAKVELLLYLAQQRPPIILAFSTFSVEPGQSVTHHWAVFNAPDGMSAMQYTFYDWHGVHVVALPGFSPYAKELQRWMTGQVIERALRVGEGREKVLKPPACEVVLADFAGQYDCLAVDIENIEGTGQITAVGIANGWTSLSIPFDSYKPYGHEAMEPGGTSEQLEAIKRVLASDVPKVFHNHTFDVPRLEQRGYRVNGPIHDTFCAMAIAYPELPHGLQASCSALLAVPPWKSLWHPKLKGITKEDIEFWICDPIGLRKYNAEDAFYTWHLARVLLPQVGVNL